MKNNIRIFTYLPNPRIWKALIAADLTKVELDIRADKPKNLSNWLWDFGARLLKEIPKKDKLLIKGTKGFSNILSKTKKFLTLNPYGNVPVAFNSSGSIGVFESNSILRLVARVGKNEINLYGQKAMEIEGKK
jgi:elongation factor 1-gamma